MRIGEGIVYREGVDGSLMRRSGENGEDDLGEV